MNYTKLQWWERFQKYYTEFPAVGLAVDLSRMNVDDAFFAVDVQAMHCTTGQFKTRMSPQASPPALFQVQNMRGGD